MTDSERDARLWMAYERMVEAAERGDYVRANKWAAVREWLCKVEVEDELEETGERNG